MGTPGLVLSLRDRRLVLDHSLVMAVVNCTPDSFSDGGRLPDDAAAIAHGLRSFDEGADVVDVGGESTRPGAEPIGPEEEERRILAVVRALAARGAVSADTYHASTAKAALEAGAAMINDVTGGTAEPAILEVAARAGAGFVLGHLRGSPRDMQQNITFADVVAEVGDELAARVERALEAGLGRDRLLADPGLGFGKSFDQNLLLLRAAGRLAERCGVPVLVGPSRKAFLGQITGKAAPARDAATHAAVAGAILAGARAVRLHDVAGGVDAARVADALLRGSVGHGP